MVLIAARKKLNGAGFHLERAAEFSDSTKLVVRQPNNANFPTFTCNVHSEGSIVDKYPYAPP